MCDHDDRSIDAGYHQGLPPITCALRDGGESGFLHSPAYWIGSILSSWLITAAELDHLGQIQEQPGYGPEGGWAKLSSVDAGIWAKYYPERVLWHGSTLYGKRSAR